MSYTSLGAYYEFTPHQIYGSFGGCGCNGLGQCGCAGLGANDIGFDADKVWADVQASNRRYLPSGDLYGICPPPSGPPNPGCAEAASASYRAIVAMQKGLNALGYTIKVGEAYGTNFVNTWKKFATDQGLAGGVDKTSIYKMQELLSTGATPGPAKAGLSKGAMLAIGAGILAVAGLAVLAKRKRTTSSTSTALARYFR